MNEAIIEHDCLTPEQKSLNASPPYCCPGYANAAPGIGGTGNISGTKQLVSPVSRKTVMRLITPNSLIAHNVNNNENRQGSPVMRPVKPNCNWIGLMLAELNREAL